MLYPGKSWMRRCFRHRGNATATARSRRLGNIPEGWEDKPAKLRQKDTGARWAVKFSKAKACADAPPQRDLAIAVLVYKSHISTDVLHGLIHKWPATYAAVHDGTRLPELLGKNNMARVVWADTA